MIWWSPGTVVKVLLSVGGLALAIVVSIYKSYIGSGSPNEAATLNTILIGARVASLIAALMVALFSREQKSGHGSKTPMEVRCPNVCSIPETDLAPSR